MKEYFKASDVYIIRPVKLVKREIYKKYYFPYNILYKLGLISKGSLFELSFKDKKSFIDELKCFIEEILPKHVHESALVVQKRYFTFNHDNLSFAIIKDSKFKSLATEYEDIFTDRVYKTLGHYCECEIGAEMELLVEKSIYSPETLVSYLVDNECIDKKSTMEEFERRVEEIREREYSMEELKQIRDIMSSEEHDSTHIVTREVTQNFIGGPFYNTAHAYDKHGNKIYPQSKTKVKTRNLLV